jgi:hypothetical protein
MQLDLHGWGFRQEHLSAFETACARRRPVGHHRHTNPSRSRLLAHLLCAFWSRSLVGPGCGAEHPEKYANWHAGQFGAVRDITDIGYPTGGDDALEEDFMTDQRQSTRDQWTPRTPERADPD